MRISLLLYSLLFTLIPFTQKKDLSQWPAKIEDEKRAALADKIIFKYKYESPDIADSVLKVIYKNKDTKAWNHYVKSEFERARSNYSTASAYADSCIEQSESEYLTIKAHCTQGKIYTTTADLSKALDYYQTALSLSNKTEYQILRSEIYAAMGEFYRKTNDYEVALEYLDSAQTLVEQYNIYDAVNIDILDRKAALYSEFGQLDSMVHYSHQALNMAIDQQNKHAQAVSHNELGYYHERLPNFDSAYYHYDKAIGIWTEIGALRYLANVQFNKARLFMKDNKNNDAKALLFETEKISEGKAWYELYPQLYEHVALVYQNEGDSVNYYKFKDKMTQAHFDRYIIENEKKIVELRSQLELQKTKDTMELQKSQIDLLKEDINQQDIRINLLTAMIWISGSLVLFMIILFIRNRKRNQQ